MQLKLTLLAVLLATNLSAYCSAPLVPYCLQSYSEADYGSCKWEVESYLSDLEDYRRCVNDEIQEAAEEAIRVFNCKVAKQCD